jgi:hypothetical protein
LANLRLKYCMAGPFESIQSVFHAQSVATGA